MASRGPSTTPVAYAKHGPDTVSSVAGMRRGCVRAGTMFCILQPSMYNDCHNHSIYTDLELKRLCKRYTHGQRVFVPAGSMFWILQPPTHNDYDGYSIYTDPARYPP